MTVLVCCSMASSGLGQCAPFWATISEGLAAAGQILPLIGRKSKIDVNSTAGRQFSSCKGKVEFKNVSFEYDQRKTVPVFSSFNLTIPAGETYALVGASGCGKSTLLSLIERFYDATTGAVCIDDNDIKEMNLSSLRNKVGLVSQMPALFPFSIHQNIALGMDGITEEQVIAAAKMANAHDFIISFPKGYQTLVGEEGSQLSGGQRQRIAIARALVRNPAILLLDEATSALDHSSELLVQKAINAAAAGCVYTRFK